jgi:hypothetical protein
MLTRVDFPTKIFLGKWVENLNYAAQADFFWVNTIKKNHKVVRLHPFFVFVVVVWTEFEIQFQRPELNFKFNLFFLFS